MTDCPFHPRLDAYHDGELPTDAARALEQHLPACPACSTELAGMRELSAGILRAAGSARLDAGESQRLHAAVTHAAEDAPISLPLLRTASLLSALAASILVISGVWLLEFRSAARSFPNAGEQRLAVAPEPDWERVAVTLHADPRPDLVHDSPDSQFSPTHFAVGWMIEGLTPTEAKPWEKPGSF